MRGTDDGNRCERQILLPDQNQIEITAQWDAPVDRCAMAEAASQNALTVLRRGAIPRRTAPFAPNSLARLDACTLPGDAVARFPASSTCFRIPPFARWACQWNGVTPDYDARVRFDRLRTFADVDDGDPIQVGDRDAYRKPGDSSDEGCVVTVVHRMYLERGETIAEIVIIDLSGPQPVEELCGPVTEIATAVVANLLAP